MKKMGKTFVYIIMLLACLGTVVVTEIYHIDRIQVISVFAAIIGVLLVAVELYQSRKISEATFLAELNQSFVSNEDYKTAYKLFENYDFENKPDLELENFHISNYLTFFEVFKLLIDKGTLSIKTINDLFGYRFFIAVHNPYVQRKKLIKSPENFRNLFILEKDWMEYRKKINQPIFHEEMALKNQVSPDLYENLIRGNKK